MHVPIVKLESGARVVAALRPAEAGAVLGGVAETFNRYVLTCSTSG